MKFLIKIMVCAAVLCGTQLFSGVTEASAQNAAERDSYDGLWAGLLSGTNNGNEIEYWIILKIENGECQTFHYDCDDGSFERAGYVSEHTMILGNNMSYVWMNGSQTAVWVETHFYALSYLNPDELSAVQMRQVTNWLPDRTNPQFNNEWDYVLRGRLCRYSGFDVLRVKLKEYYIALGC